MNKDLFSHKFVELAILATLWSFYVVFYLNPHILLKDTIIILFRKTKSIS